MKRFMLALRFLTVFPFGSDGEATADDMAGSAVYYPLVGAILGMVLFWFWQAARTIWPVFLVSALTVTLWVALTAGLHLDGLMDTFDGLGVRGNREKRLAVMRDSRVGAFGAQAAVLSVFLKIAAVSALSAGPSQFPALMLAPVAGRTAIVAFMGTSRYARDGEGLGKAITEGTGWPHLIAALFLFLILGYAAVGANILWVFLSQLIFFAILRRFVQQNFGGITGDVLGAVCEAHELALLILAPLVLR